VLIGTGKSYPGNLIVERAQALWKEEGGSLEGWELWLKPLDSATVPNVAERSGAPPHAPTALGWTDIDRSFNDLSLSDLTGKTWTIADLKGKITLVNVWATWCAPCVAELPYVQVLFDKIKNRAEIQLITLDIDDNPGLVDLFVKKEKFTFPVIIAEGYFAQIQPPLSIPRTWIIDRAGTARLEKVDANAGAPGESWATDVLDQLSRQ
jgi:thiol-disulfide isomerase/thioredoxin